MKAIWLTGVNCGTSDDVFTACQRLSPIGYGGCSGSQQIVAVRCGKMLVCACSNRRQCVHCDKLLLIFNTKALSYLIPTYR